MSNLNLDTAKVGPITETIQGFQEMVPNTGAPSGEVLPSNEIPIINEINNRQKEVLGIGVNTSNPITDQRADGESSIDSLVPELTNTADNFFDAHSSNSFISILGTKNNGLKITAGYNSLPLAV